MKKTENPWNTAETDLEPKPRFKRRAPRPPITAAPTPRGGSAKSQSITDLHRRYLGTARNSATTA